MEKRIKLVIGGLFAVLIFAFGVWFWSLGAVASEDVPTIRVEASKPTVEIKKKETSDWVRVETAQEVGVGDEVRTDKDGAAQIYWGDRGVTRLDPNTMLIIEEMPADPSAVTEAAIRLKLESGRVWSRVLKLFGPESAFEVKTNSVVATVRGTAYGVARVSSSTEIAVNEGVVEAVSAKGGDGMFVRQGKFGDFEADGSLRYLRDLDKSNVWADANRKLDQMFDDELASITAMRFGKLQKSAPEWLTELSEDLHLKLAGESKDVLSGKYAQRRIAALAIGRNVPMESISRLAPLMAGKSREKSLGDIRLALLMVRTPAVGKRYADPGAHKLDALETLRTHLLSDGMPGEISARLVHLSESTVRFWQEHGRSDESLQRDISDLRKQILNSPDLSEMIRKKLDRDALALLDFDQATTVTTGADNAVGSVSSTGISEVRGQDLKQPSNGQSPSSGAIADPKTPVRTEAKPIASCVYQVLTLMAKPDKGVSVGDAVELSLYGNCQDGRTDDLTKMAIFNPGYTADGKVAGNTFFPAKDGVIKLYGTIELNGQVRSTMTEISVTRILKKVTDVKVSTFGITTITTGQSLPLQAIAGYSDGSTTDVTYQCRWMTSDGRLAMVSNQRLQSLSGTGDVSATCNYSENGVNVFGSVLVAIKLDPALQPLIIKPSQPPIQTFKLY